MGGNPRIPGSQMGQQIPMQMRMPTQQQQQMGQPHQATPHQQRMPMGHGGQSMGPMGSFAPNQGGNQSMQMGSQVGPIGAQIGGMGPGPSQQNWGSGGGRVPPTQPQQQEGMFSGGGGGGGQGHPPPQYNVAMAQQVWSLTQTFQFYYFQTCDLKPLSYQKISIVLYQKFNKIQVKIVTIPASAADATTTDAATAAVWWRWGNQLQSGWGSGSTSAAQQCSKQFKKSIAG